MNQVYNGYDKEQLKEAADENFNELDLTVLMGYPFRHNARYTGNENKSKKSNYKGNYDLFIKTRGFKIEVKFLKNWRSEADTLAASKNWKPFLKDFNWLMNEIDTKGKGKVAFVIGWFNCVEYFSSRWNEIDDYQAVRESGVEFAIVKVNNAKNQADARFYKHMEGFKAAGVPVIGGYHYCYANTIEKAKQAADSFVNIGKPQGINCMWLDLESYKEELREIPFWWARYPYVKERTVEDAVPSITYLPQDMALEGWKYSSMGKIAGVKGYIDLNVWFESENYDDKKTEISVDYNPFVEPMQNVRLGTTGNDANWVLWYLWRFGKLTDAKGNPDKTLINGVITEECIILIKEVQALLGLEADGIVGKEQRLSGKK